MPWLSSTLSAMGQALRRGRPAAAHPALLGVTTGPSFTAAADQGHPLISGFLNSVKQTTPLTLHGVGTSWDQGTAFTVSGVTEVTITAQRVESATLATITVQVGPYFGALSISDGSSSTQITIAGIPGQAVLAAVSDPKKFPPAPPKIPLFAGQAVFGDPACFTIETLGGGWRLHGRWIGPSPAAVAAAAAALASWAGQWSTLQLPTGLRYPSDWVRHPNCSFQLDQLDTQSITPLGPNWAQKFCVTFRGSAAANGD
jgi:hypothetical protein